MPEKKIVILLLNETHLSTNKTFKVPNFIIHITKLPCTNEQHPAGGIAILMHRQLIHYQQKYKLHLQYHYPVKAGPLCYKIDCSI